MPPLDLWFQTIVFELFDSGLTVSLFLYSDCCSSLGKRETFFDPIWTSKIPAEKVLRKCTLGSLRVQIFFFNGIAKATIIPQTLRFAACSWHGREGPKVRGEKDKGPSLGKWSNLTCGYVFFFKLGGLITTESIV